jgi:phospho-N-acetylmuramoyl-pentapeptide-transferase
MDVRSIYTWIVVFVSLGAGLLGFIDDFLKITQAKEGIHARTKIIGQVVIGLITGIILVMTGNEEITRVYIPFLKDVYVDLGTAGYVFFVMLIIISSSNAVNHIMLLYKFFII